MKITYIYNSCFHLEFQDFSVLIDYYADTKATDGFVGERVLKSDKPLYVMASHVHGDHYNKKILKWKENNKNIKYILSHDILEEGEAAVSDGVFLDKGDEFTDENLFVKAYGSTDAGISFYIKAEGKTIFHAGDLNNWHWKLEAEKEESLGYEKAFEKELADVMADIKTVDVLMFPVDPRLEVEYYKGALQCIAKIKTGLFVPMHFREEYKLAQLFEAEALKYCNAFFNITERGVCMQW